MTGSDSRENAPRRRTYTLEGATAYVWHNRWKVLRDTVAALAIVLGVAVVFSTVDFPDWTYYVVLFLVFVAYTYVVDPWEWPDDEWDE